jgi:low affinity Fe/Cu permease
VSSVTLLMVFTIQHTQGREQAATQRKLDELLRATPGAAEALMMLEEAPREFMLEVEDKQRGVRADLVDDVEAHDAQVEPGGAQAE